MSDAQKKGSSRAKPRRGRRAAPAAPVRAGPAAHALVMPTAKAKDVRGALRRLAGQLKPERALLIAVVLLAVVSVAFAVVGPKILGTATNIIFEGVVSKQIPAGVTKEQAIAGLRAKGQDRVADMISGMTLDPGHGIDFDALGRTLLLLVGVYAFSALFAWLQAYLMAGVAQRTIYRLRRQADEKLARLPLRYFDDHPRGDVLSRMTNDIDNISQSLQQSLTQIITSTLTIIGVLIMMLSISWLLALISVLVVPVSVVVTMIIAKRSQKQFAAQWETTGDLNGHVEEMFTGHNVVKVFGRQQAAIDTFDEQNETLYQASFKAQFISGIIMPVMNFVMNLNYVAIAVIGGVMVASGRMSLGDVQAFIQYSRQFTMPITQVASIMNVLQSTAASAERVFELLDEAEEMPDADRLRRCSTTRAATSSFDDVSFRYVPDTPLISGLTLDVAPGETVAIVGPTGAGKTTLVNLLLRFYDVDDGRHQRRRRRRPGTSPAATCGACSAWCCRTRGCSAAPSARTSPTGARARPRTRSARPPRRRASTTSCARSPTATTRCSTTTPPTSPRASASCSPSHGRSSPTRTSSSSTRPPAPWTRAPRC